MSKEAFSSELLSPLAQLAPTGEAGRRPQAYVDFKHSFKAGGILIFHSSNEIKPVTGLIADFPPQEGENKKHFALGVNILDDEKYTESLSTLEKSGFNKEKPNKDDYKLEEKTRLAHQ